MPKRKKINPEENIGASIGKSWIQDCKRDPKACAESLAKQECRNNPNVTTQAERINCLCGVEKALNVDNPVICMAKEKDPNLRSATSFKKNLKKTSKKR